MAAAAPLSASAPGRFAPHSPHFPAPTPSSPLAYQEGECRDPPIYEDILQIDATPFNYGRLQHGYRGYIGTKEKRQMSEFGYRSLLADPDVQELYRLRKVVHQLYEADADWGVACAGVGDTLANADPNTELILAKLGMAAMYEHRDRLWGEATLASLTAFVPPEFGCEIRKRKDERLEDWIPVCWHVLNEVQKQLVIEDAKQRVAEMERVAAERSKRIRLNKQEIKQRLSLEMKQIREEMERNRQNPHWLAQQLRSRYGADDLDADNLPPLTVLQERYERAEEQENETIRKATLAPVPGKEPDNIPMMFAMESLETE